MEIHTLCDEIQLQPEIKSRVFDFVNAFEFAAVDRQLIALRDYEKMSEALAELQTILGEDTDNIKILACMLKASADLYDIYKEMGISDEIYIATMKCYSRFIDETYHMTGKLYFDRSILTTVSLSVFIFRRMRIFRLPKLMILLQTQGGFSQNTIPSCQTPNTDVIHGFWIII